MLQKIKDLMRDSLGLPPWLVLVVAGLVAHIALNSIFRKPLNSAFGLLAPLALGLALESVEIWMQYRNTGLFAAGNDPVLVIFSRHGLDILKMLAAPMLLVAVGIFSAR